MKITDVRAHLLSYPLPETLRLPYHGGLRTIVKRDAMLIRVDTEKGVVGWAPGQPSESVRDAVHDVIRPFLVDRELGDPDALRVQFLEACPDDAELLRAYCSVEIALYDARGKALGVPVSELLGGRARDRIRLYGSAGMYMPPRQYAEEAQAIREQGFSAYKMRPALGPERDLETIELIRKSTGPFFDIMVDAHSWWRMGDLSYDEVTVIDLAREFSKFDIAWLEEPLAPADHEAYSDLRKFEYVPLAAGEHEQSEAGLLNLISGECVDFVQMDIVVQGGYPRARRVFPEIARAGLGFAFHSWGTPLEIAAAAHIGICWPETVVGWLEYPCYSSLSKPGMYPFPLADEILVEPPTMENGYLVVPATAGLGVEVNEAVIDKYPWLPGPWSYFHLNSPAGTWAVTADHSKPWHGDAPL